MGYFSFVSVRYRVAAYPVHQREDIEITINETFLQVTGK